MRLFLWWCGRALQLMALLQVGWALLVGFSSHDATAELKLMLLGVVEFLAGQFLLSRTGGDVT